MNLLQRDLVLMLRKPSYWLVLAVMAFLLGWIALVMTDMVLSRQAGSDLVAEVSLARSLMAPFFTVVSLFSLAITALLAGQLVSAERSEKTLMALLESGIGDSRVLAQKYLAMLLLVTPVLLPVGVVLLGWSQAGQLEGWLIFWNLLAWWLLEIWFAAGMLWLALNVSQGGLAALLGLVLLALLWLMGQSGTGQDWGKNWIQAFSPRFHFELIQHGLLPVSSLLYFVIGALLLFLLALWSLKRMRLP
jgi:ABC-type transport system involved in multi-copper enzyme maturation permease subunit